MATMRNVKKIVNKTFVNKNLTAIFFDLDNTLIPTRKGDAKTCKKLCDTLCEQYGISYEQAQCITSKFLQKFRSCPDNPETDLYSWRSYLWSESLPDSMKQLSAEIYKKWIQLRYKYLALTQEIENLLKSLRLNGGYRLALITNGPSNAQWEKITKLNLKQYFDCILVSSDLPWEKPHPNIFLTACKFLNVSPDECVMIGDKLETDIKGGKDANLGATVWIPLSNTERTKFHGQPVPDLIIDDVSQLSDYLPINRTSSSRHSGFDDGGNSMIQTKASMRRHSQTSAGTITPRLFNGGELYGNSSTSSISSTKAESKRKLVESFPMDVDDMMTRDEGFPFHHSIRKPYQYRRVLSLSEIECSDNSSDCS